jgi:hypothetical protein
MRSGSRTCSAMGYCVPVSFRLSRSANFTARGLAERWLTAVRRLRTSLPVPTPTHFEIIWRDRFRFVGEPSLQDREQLPVNGTELDFATAQHGISALLLRGSSAHASLAVRQRTTHSRTGKQSRESIRTGLTAFLTCQTCRESSHPG